jgi:hypothetical protein
MLINYLDLKITLNRNNNLLVQVVDMSIQPISNVQIMLSLVLPSM